jgi:hypothetical protein
MRIPVLAILAALSGVAALPDPALAQPAPRPLAMVPEARFEIGRLGQPRDAIVAVGQNGHVAIMSRYSSGEIQAFDSTGKRLGWKVPLGRQDNAEILYPSHIGWLGDSAYVIDDGFHQVALLDPAGKVFRSIEYPSWVHPHWAERRKYPVFASMQPIAMYPDHSMLIFPGRERSLLTVNGYDRSVAHLLHVSSNGAIDRGVATLPIDRGNLTYRSGGCFHSVNVPLSAPLQWAVAANGARITFATPALSEADSGTFRLTTLTDRGDTVFSRRYAQPVQRTPKDAADRFLASLQSCGKITETEIRERAAKLIPAFRSFVTGVVAGHDGSTAVLMRTASDTSRQRIALVVDPRGDVVGSLVFTIDQAVADVTRDHVWMVEMGPSRTAASVVRYRISPTNAPPARSVPVSSSSRPSRPPA